MTIYKYVPLERIDILQKRRIRFTQPGAFNDLFEFLYGLGTQAKDWRADRLLHHTLFAESFGLPRKTTLEDISALVDPPDDFFAEQNVRADKPSNRWGKSLLAAKELVRIVDQHVGILSLAKRPDNVLMWSHYSDNHKGLVIGFDEQHPFFTDGPQQFQPCPGLREVRYRHRRLRLPFHDIAVYHILFVKSKDWTYEQEFRIVKPLHQGTRLRRSSSTDFLGPFEEPPPPVFLFKIPLDCIESLIFGARTPDTEQAWIEEDLLRRRPFRHVQLYRAFPHPSEYKMDILNYHTAEPLRA